MSEIRRPYHTMDLWYSNLKQWEGQSVYTHWGTEFTWPYVAGCNVSSRHPVYRSVPKVKVMEWPLCRKATEAGQVSLEWRTTALPRGKVCDKLDA